MKIDPTKVYTMPLITGPTDLRVGLLYGEVDTLALQYETDPDAIQVLLPECYQPAEKPSVTVMFGYNNGVGFMAGGGYRIATVQVAARFDGEQDHIEGDYVLVMFEDQTFPIIGGREQLGVPKLYAEISPVKTVYSEDTAIVAYLDYVGKGSLVGHLRCEASLWGHLLFGMDLAPLKEQNAIVRFAASKRMNERRWLGYKYIPCLDGPPDASYPTVIQNDSKVEQLWLGNSGQVFFGDAAEEQIGLTKPVIDALKTLPVRHVTRTARLRGSAVLRQDLCRRLR